MLTFFLSLLIFLVVVMGMAAGVPFGRQSLKACCFGTGAPGISGSDIRAGAAARCERKTRRCAPLG